MSRTYKNTLHACYLGYISQAIVNNLAPLLFIIFQNQYNISFEMIGRLILINFGTQLIVDALSVKFVDKIGYRVSVLLAHFLCVVGLVGLGTLPRIFPSPYYGLATAVALYAIGGGLIEVLISPIVDSLPGDAKASAMSLLHSFYCWGQVGVVLVSTLFIKIAGNGAWYILPIIWAVIPAYNFFKFIHVPLASAVPEHEKIPVRQLLNSRLFLIAMLLMVCAGASEQAMSQWASLFAQEGLKISKVIGDLLGPCLFAVLMGTGRIIYGIYGHKIHLRKALAGCAVLCVCCYVVTVFVQIPIVSLLGCAFCGLAVSLMWPGVFSMTSEKHPGGGTAMFGILAIFGDLGCSVGPWLAGLISDLSQKSDKLVAIGRIYGLNTQQVGLKTGIFAATVFPFLMIIGIFLFRDVNKTSN
ncbi:MAG TPA: MFS transporter [Ruminiclostridium sp.]|nr:MFS transporter [Ruminiclostridium sp.]